MFVQIPTPTEAYLDKDFLPESDKKPPKRKLVPMILSHGYMSRGMNYSMHCRELASHGMLVVAPDHLDGSCSYTINQKTEKPVFFGRHDVSSHEKWSQTLGEMLP